MMGEVSNGDVGGRIWSCGAWLVNGFGLVVIWFVEARRLGSWFVTGNGEKGATRMVDMCLVMKQWGMYKQGELDEG
ncbi:hypothetical protein V6N13_110830 [Hibiscus sabdariffa]